MRGTIEMRRALKRCSYDALFTNASVGVFFSRTFRRIPTLIDFDSTPLQIDRMSTYASTADSKPLAGFKWRLFRDKMQAATLLHAWSNWAKDSVVNEYGIQADKVVVNPPGVRLDFWCPDPDARKHIPGHAPRVLFVGGDFRRKGGDQLLAWFDSQQPSECELHVVTREPVESRPGLFVYNDMEPNSNRLLRLYRSSDLFVLPSLGECFGIATVEAMAAGLPVIASDVGGVADIIEHEYNGFIVPSNDGTALGRAIGAVLGNEQLRKEMGFRSRRLAEERFDVRKNAHRTFQYLKQIAAVPQEQSEEQRRKGAVEER